MVVTIDIGMILALVKIINWIMHIAVGLVVIFAMDFLEKKSAKVSILIVAIWIMKAVMFGSDYRRYGYATRICIFISSNILLYSYMGTRNQLICLCSKRDE